MMRVILSRIIYPAFILNEWFCGTWWRLHFTALALTILRFQSYWAFVGWNWKCHLTSILTTIQSVIIGKCYSSSIVSDSTNDLSTLHRICDKKNQGCIKAKGGWMRYWLGGCNKVPRWWSGTILGLKHCLLVLFFIIIIVFLEIQMYFLILLHNLIVFYMALILNRLLQYWLCVHSAKILIFYILHWIFYFFWSSFCNTVSFHNCWVLDLPLDWLFTSPCWIFKVSINHSYNFKKFLFVKYKWYKSISAVALFLK